MKQELIKAFQDDKFGNIRVVSVGGREYLVATDVAKALGYTNPQKAIRDHCKGVNETFIPTNGGKQLAKVIPEGDVYRLITHSKLPSAEEFERWVFDEVLPSIRKHGAYLTSEIRDKLKENPNYITELIQRLEDRESEIKELEQANELLTNNYNDVKLMWNNCTNDIMEFVQSQLVHKKSSKVRCVEVYNTYHRSQMVSK